MRGAGEQAKTGKDGEHRAAPVSMQSLHEDQQLLQQAVTRRQHLEELAMQYEQLRTNIAMLRDTGAESFKSLVNIGRDFFLQAKVADCSRVVVTLGAGVAVEMTHDEALAFIDSKQVALQASVQASVEHCAALSAQVRRALSDAGGEG